MNSKILNSLAKSSFTLYLFHGYPANLLGYIVNNMMTSLSSIIVLVMYLSYIVFLIFIGHVLYLFLNIMSPFLSKKLLGVK